MRPTAQLTWEVGKGEQGIESVEDFTALGCAVLPGLGRVEDLVVTDSDDGHDLSGRQSIAFDVDDQSAAAGSAPSSRARVCAWSCCSPIVIA
ncbi:hypothetical protein [Streptomyces europaeiscabiei]|uniref:hypothetical protein n=1 Tax=Streptomyces europaeiscabiei TaxID=146819 RepID=UPI0029ACDC38|nr:hypothetical protein [Streptomyces europaeiscabiei]MDX3589104.1 hypothetical protein [Streptomyces europaeiscabiei]